MIPPQATPSLPRVHPEVYDRMSELARTIAEAPLPAARHQALGASIRGVIGYVAELEAKAAKLEEELAKAQSAPKPTE